MSIQLPGQRICESPTPIRADSTDCQFRAANEVNAEAGGSTWLYPAKEHSYLSYPPSHRVREFDANEKLSNYSVKIIKVVEHDGQMSEKNSSTARHSSAMINGTATPSSVESLRRVVVQCR